MERKALIALATKLGLEFKKNMSTDKLLELVAERMNEVVKPVTKVFCGKSPITGKEVWK
jgi:hypothetical protein